MVTTGPETDSTLPGPEAKVASSNVSVVPRLLSRSSLTTSTWGLSPTNAPFVMSRVTGFGVTPGVVVTVGSTTLIDSTPLTLPPSRPSLIVNRMAMFCGNVPTAPSGGAVYVNVAGLAPIWVLPDMGLSTDVNTNGSPSASVAMSPAMT